MSMKKWVKHGSTVGFLFFFVKGLVWLGIAALAAVGIW